MSISDSIILGIVEGLTEFLPISSTGHLILTSQLLRLPETDFLKAFEVSIQLGAILAALFLYWKKLFLNREIFFRVSVALIPALGVGFLFYSTIKQLLGSPEVVVWSLLVGGIIIILFETFHRHREGNAEDLSTLPYQKAFLIGLAQALAVIPGVSRAGATILGGLALGLKRTAIVEFSFLLAIPTMMAATGLEIIKDPSLFASGNFELLAAGFGTSFIVALLAIKFFLRFIGTHTFVSFGVYRILVAFLFFWLVL